MVSVQKILEQLTGNAQALVEAMAERDAEFADARNRYEKAMEVLARELDPGSSPTVREEQEAIEQQTLSTLVFSGFLGLQANLENFINPVAGDFLNAEAEAYLRENTARRLPGYVSAQQVRDSFYRRLSPDQREVYGEVISYTSCMETVAPKLAHYYGYLLGNALLYRIIPGYHHDATQTAKYTMLLKDYFGKVFP